MLLDVKATVSNEDDHLKTENPLFQDVAQEYMINIRKRCTQSFCDDAKNIINSIWNPALGLKPIKDIRVKDVRKADQEPKWSSAKRRRNARSVLRGIFDIAIADELIDENPANKLKKISHQAPDIDPFTAEEKEAILKNLYGQAYLYFVLAFETGMRTGELLGLRWSDFRDGKAYLERTLVRGKIKDMKIKKCRAVALSKRALTSLDYCDRLDPKHLWLNQDGTPLLECKPLWKQWKAALANGNIRYRKAYNCRHTRASLGLSAGQTPAWLAAQLGHDLRTFFTNYARFMEGNTDSVELAKMELQKI